MSPILRPALVALALMSSPALTQEGDGMDVNMDALKAREAAPKPPPSPEQRAARKAEKFTGRELTVPFGAGASTLTPAAVRQLDAIAAENPAQRLELMAYAGSTRQSASETGRLSLKRAQVVRDRLVAKGMDASRISLRPQGPAPEGAPPDRVVVRFLAE
jgi:OOP family OmpA-OmpF porin